MKKTRRSIKKYNNKQKKHKFFFVFFLAISFFLFFYLISLDPKQSVFPAPPSDQPSPKKYLKMRKDTSSVSLPLPEVIEHGSRDKKRIALTFDADMTYGMLDMLKDGRVKSWYNKSLKDYLKKENIKATIFMTGLWVQRYSKEAREIASDPLFEIGNHSYSHPAFASHCFGLPLIDRDQVENEVDKAQKEILSVTGVFPLYFRFPGGCYEQIDVDSISKLGLKIVHWDVVGGDAFNNNPDDIARNIESNVKNGSIVILHFNDGLYAPETYEALKLAIPILRQRGFEFVKVSELLVK